MKNVLLLAGSASAILNPDLDVAWTAEKKGSSIWKMVLDNSGTSTWWWFPFVDFTITTYNFKLMYEKTDFVQHTWDKLWMAPRDKPIHRRGVVQQITWTEEAGLAHHAFEDDIEDHPEWEKVVPSYSTWNLFHNIYTDPTPGYANVAKSAGGCPFGYRIL